MRLFSFQVCSELSTNPKAVEKMSFSFQLGQILLFQDSKLVLLLMEEIPHQKNTLPKTNISPENKVF